MIQLRPHQEYGATKGVEILSKYNIVYINFQTRVGKTLTALTIAHRMGYGSVLVLTKKNAIDSIKSDMGMSGYTFNLHVTNYEQAPNIDGKQFDLIILDESNEKISAFPKMGKYAKYVQKLCKMKPIIFCSATPTPESKSQIYHQLAMSSFSPFIDFKNFYAWSKVYVNVKKRVINGFHMNDYSNANDKLIDEKINHLFISISQEEAGFNEEIKDIIHEVTMLPITYKIISKVKKDKILEGRTGNIIADTAARVMQTEHQLATGTIKLDNGRGVTIDQTKVDYIKDNFHGRKLAIYYNYIQEFEMLKDSFPNWTNSDVEFNESKDMVYLGQFVSKRSGISLRTADDLIFISVPFSATSYFQARSRHAHKDRTDVCNVHFILAKKTIDGYVYKMVKKKKNFTLRYYKRIKDV